VNKRDIKEKRSSMKCEQKRHKILVRKSPRMRELTRIRVLSEVVGAAFDSQSLLGPVSHPT
jgi:hypothetical protein